MELFRLPLKKQGPHKTVYVRKFSTLKNREDKKEYKGLSELLKKDPHLDLDRINETNENFLELDRDRNSILKPGKIKYISKPSFVKIVPRTVVGSEECYKTGQNIVVRQMKTAPVL